MSAYVISELEVRDPVAIETYRTIAAKSSNYHAHDDSSPNNVDINWLRLHATSPIH